MLAPGQEFTVSFTGSGERIQERSRRSRPAALHADPSYQSALDAIRRAPTAWGGLPQSYADGATDAWVGINDESRAVGVNQIFTFRAPEDSPERFRFIFFFRADEVRGLVTYEYRRE